MIESLTLAFVGGIIGVALSYGGVQVLLAVGPSNLPRLQEISIDPIVLALAFAVSLVSGALLGVVPILRHAGPRFTTVLGSARRGATFSRDRQRSQHTLVTVQIALALVLLVSAGLMIRSFQALLRVEPGFAGPEHVQAFSVSIPQTLVADRDRVMRIQHAIVDEIATISGVESVAFTTRLPLDFTDRWSAALSVEGKPDDRLTPPNRQVKVISPGTFQTLGTALVAGRDFTWTDLYELRSVAIVSENLAREFWGSSAAALGRRVREYYPPIGPWREIVGVAADVHDDGLHRAPPATIYWPARLDGPYQPRTVSMAVRTDLAGTEGLIKQLHEAVWTVNPNLPLARVGTLEALYSGSLAETSFTLVLLAVAGAMALLLGVIGVYGVISHAVAQRRKEIGIRLALGAQGRQIQLLFIRRGAMLTAIGILFGLGGAAAFARWMRGLLFEVEPLDSVTYTTVPMILMAAAMLASYLPARRALSVDPVETMRAE
jgi:predicted permease